MSSAHDDVLAAPAAHRPAPWGRRAGDQRLDWAVVHRTTRLQATVTNFGWLGKTVLCLPPVAVLAFWADSGIFDSPLFALGVGVPMLWAVGWWCKQVWSAAGRVTGAAALRNRKEGPAAAQEFPEAPRGRIHPNFAYLYERPPAPTADR